MNISYILDKFVEIHKNDTVFLSYQKTFIAAVEFLY